MSGLQKTIKKYISLLLALVLITGAVFGVKKMEETVPEYPWIDKVPETGTAQNYAAKGEDESEDSREKEEKADSELAENPSSGKENSTADNLPEKPPGNPQEILKDDLEEDAFAKEFFSEDALSEEMGLGPDEKIQEIKVITAPGEETRVTASGGSFEISLSTKGTTILQISYIDGSGNRRSYIKKVQYERPEGTTPAEKMPVIETNLKDGATYNQKELNFDVWLTDYRGQTLSYSNMEVTCNGKAADYIGEMDRQTYSVYLKEGENKIQVTARDVYQYTVTRVWTLWYRTGAGEIIISLEAGTVGIPYLIRPQTMKAEEGESLASVVDRFLKSNGFSCRHAGTIENGFYLAAVEKKGMLSGFSIPEDLAEKIEEDGLIFDRESYAGIDELGEFDFSQGSGWMYSINGIYSSYGLSKAYVQDGDVVRLRFTLAYGKDIGGYKAMGMNYGKLKNYGKEW